MDTKIKIKQVHISKGDQQKMDKIGYYWTCQQRAEITSLLKEYQDIFLRDYKDMKGLVK